MHHSVSTTYSCSSRLRNSLQIALMPSNNMRPVIGSPGGGCGGGGGGRGDVRLPKTVERTPGGRRRGRRGRRTLCPPSKNDGEQLRCVVRGLVVLLQQLVDFFPAFCGL